MVTKMSEQFFGDTLLCAKQEGKARISCELEDFYEGPVKEFKGLKSVFVDDADSNLFVNLRGEPSTKFSADKKLVCEQRTHHYLDAQQLFCEESEKERSP